ncbi:hypothetical protein [Thalassomonas actiniarum]|uniref:Uncharacterized protein n=1 Tax=Thalassomonas actiniarum TaxID=485447 RepID=A0AAE9YL26_9GAMM|nr:hypothetical protein [Thalassomonas actiniarum]WDD97445.1 hypothetical protein SG35_019265 [Thalassomonas actiniarum]
MDEIELKKLEIEKEKLALERQKLSLELRKWVVVAIAAVISFFLIDYGKLTLERTKEESMHDRELLKSYLKAMDSSKPEIWKRKLRFIKSFAKDERVLSWAEEQLTTLSKLPPKESLYLEAADIAKKLSRREPLNEELWTRFEQLYWSELPLANESMAMEDAMVNFRQSLLDAHEAPIGDDDIEWDNVKKALLKLSKVVSSEMPNKALQTTAESGV